MDKKPTKKSQFTQEESENQNGVLEDSASWDDDYFTPRPRTKHMGPLKKAQQIAALNWAAEKANTTYGKLVSTLSLDEKSAIYQEYAEYLKERKAQEDARTEELRAIARKVSKSKPAEKAESNEGLMREP